MYKNKIHYLGNGFFALKWPRLDWVHCIYSSW